MQGMALAVIGCRLADVVAGYRGLLQVLIKLERESNRESLAGPILPVPYERHQDKIQGARHD